VYFAVTAFGSYLGTGLAIEGSLLFLNYLFSTWRIRKVYVETTPEALARYASGLSLLREEGRLIDHEYLKGAYHDHMTYAIYRRDFHKFVQQFAPLFGSTFEAEL
jgi:RimJ/RimL family protein N-acetyltransferase